MRNRFPKNVYDPINKKNMPTTPAVRHSFSWKTWIGLCVMSVLTVFAALWWLTKDEDPNILEQFEKKRWRREIPNPEVPLPSSASVLHTFRHAAVSSDTQVCSEIARDVMQKSSGNVFDAAVSCLLCNSLTQTQSMGLMGGFLMTVYQAGERRAFTVDAQMTSPKSFKLPIESFEKVKEGPLAVAVPGFIKGLWKVHKSHGSLKWKDLVQPIINICHEGLTISKHFHDSLKIANVSSDPYLRRLYYSEETKSFVKPGVKVKNGKFCKFLAVLRDNEDEEIFGGKIGDILVDDLKDAGAVIRRDDLMEYEVKVRDPIQFNLTDEVQLFVPKTAAILVPTILNILKQYNFKNFSLNSLKNVSATILSHHRIIESFKYAFAARTKLADPDFVDVEKFMREIITEKFAQDIYEKIHDGITQDYDEYGADEYAPTDHGTSHISIIAPNGDAISVTSSINFYFGSKLSGKRSGLIFNNGMDDFSYPGRALNYFNLNETSLNYPEPRKRALSSMSPMLLVDASSGHVQMVIGAAGGSKIISTLSVAVLQFLCCTKNIKEIVDAARIHHQLVPNEIEFEYGLIKGIIEGLAAKGHKMRRFNDRGTIVNALTKVRRDQIHGVSDYRKDWSGVAGF